MSRLSVLRKKVQGCVGGSKPLADESVFRGIASREVCVCVCVCVSHFTYVSSFFYTGSFIFSDAPLSLLKEVMVVYH